MASSLTYCKVAVLTAASTVLLSSQAVECQRSRGLGRPLLVGGAVGAAAASSGRRGNRGLGSGSLAGVILSALFFGIIIMFLIRLAKLRAMRRAKLHGQHGAGGGHVGLPVHTAAYNGNASPPEYGQGGHFTAAAHDGVPAGYPTKHETAQPAHAPAQPASYGIQPAHIAAQQQQPMQYASEPPVQGVPAYPVYGGGINPPLDASTNTTMAPGKTNHPAV